MKKQIKVSNKVYAKEFSIKPMGYACEEVDAFLDEINIEIGKLERDIETLEKDLQREKSTALGEQQRADALFMEVNRLKANGGVSIKDSSSFSNIDLFNRIANIETMLKKLTDEKNKS